MLDALAFGRGEPDPVTVAAAVGMLQGNPGTPFVTQFAIDQSGDPATMSLPRRSPWTAVPPWSSGT